SLCCCSFVSDPPPAELYTLSLHDALPIFYIGFHLTFFIQHILGLIGMQRRIYTYMSGQGLETMNMVSTIGSFVMSAAIILLVVKDRKSTRLNSSHVSISYAVFCLKKKSIT